jgi:hypothetical protein
MWWEICCCWPCIKRSPEQRTVRSWVGIRNERDKASLHSWPRRTKKEENAVKLEWLERRRRSGSSKGGSGGDEWDEEVGFSGGMGDWEGRIDSDERSKAEERTLVGDEVGEGSGSVPVKAEGKKKWVVAREGEEAYMMRD